MLNSVLGPDHAFTQTSQKMVESCENLISMVRAGSLFLLVVAVEVAVEVIFLMVHQREFNH